MTKVVGAVVFAALLVAAQDKKHGGTGSQGKPLGPRAADACDLKKIELAPYCNECSKIMEDKEVAGHKKEAGGGSHTIVKRKVCVKKYYHADCHPENDSYDKGQCCGKDKEEKVSKSAIWFQCEGCSAPAEKEGTCQFDECPKKKTRAECTMQPSFPHTNEKKWRDDKKKEEKK